MARTVSIAACNFAVRPVASFDEFADHVRGLLDGAQGADLVLFPELFTVELFTTFADWQNTPATELTLIDKYTGDYKSLFESEAKERSQFIVAGSHLMEVDGRYLNIGHVYGPEGLVFEHVKTHIFPAESNWHTEEGESVDAFDLPFARVGLNICYEAEIPECSTTLVEQGAEIILCPSYTFTEYGFWRVRHCAQARAIENQVYFVHCCTGGQPGGTLPNGWAQSSILSPCDVPWTPSGIVAQADANKEMVVRGEVDLDKLYENRENGAAPTFRDRRRRRDLYVSWPSHLEGAQATR
ncbi:putative amidohydrolase [Gaiella occulta]|uniref:Putative amidohydrolase n=1 Tax=Gaiella occulta TaxID=1002870 RepID=A0A7M2YWD5_9ACTN|nr:carbon-nitrogen hydrolase family protein [Gaiella occulta]RDI74204.1 putative amidohydrolase [Gaiella occulta]